MFNGQSEHTCDQKGRVIIPSKFREELGDSFFIARGFEHEDCLFVYSKEEWHSFLTTLTEPSDFDSDVRRRRRLFSASSEECETDKQGRVLIPSYLREYAGIQSSVTVIGNISRLEIWDSEKWKAYQRGV